MANPAFERDRRKAANLNVMHEPTRRRRKIALAVLVGYVLAYGLLRVAHVIVHEGAYYDKGVKKFHNHQLGTETTISVLLPLGALGVNVFFFPAMVSELLFWHCVKPPER